MIERPIVLVLGAGASLAYGLPSSKDLRLTILGYGADALFQGIGVDAARLKEFQEAFRRSRTLSIDKFLLTRREYLEVGKLAIARAIIADEHEQKVFTNARVREGEVQEDWYEYFFNLIHAPTFDEFRRNEFSVITFNYDRSFEFCLFEFLRNVYDEEEDAVAEMIRSTVPIVHVHGRVGGLPQLYQDEFVRPYFPNDSVDTIPMAAKAIRLVHEDHKDVELQNRIRSLLFGAESVFFLGFGYAEENMERLGVGGAVTERKLNGITTELAFHGTVKNLTPAEIGTVVHPHFLGAGGITIHDQTVLEFLRTQRHLITGAEIHRAIEQHVPEGIDLPSG